MSLSGWSWIKKNYKAIITVVVAVVLIVGTYGLATTYLSVAAAGGGTTLTLGGEIVVGAAVGAGVSASTTAITRGSWRAIRRSALKGAATGSIAAGVAGGILHTIGDIATAAGRKQYGRLSIRK